MPCCTIPQVCYREKYGFFAGELLLDKISDIDIYQIIRTNYFILDQVNTITKYNVGYAPVSIPTTALKYSF